VSLARAGLQVSASARRGRSNRRKEAWVRLFCYVCASFSVLVVLGILFVLAREAFAFFADERVTVREFLTGREWTPTFAEPKFGILPLLNGTLLITAGAAVIALPLGLLCAIYMGEYASARVRAVLKPFLEILAGIPTVVYGYFALVYITPVIRVFLPETQVFNALSGMIVVGIMILPLVASLSEDALSAVPKELREGAYGMGSTKMEVTTKIVLPAALSAVGAAFIIAVSRAIGETMAVTLAAGTTPRLTMNPLESIQTMTAFIVQISKGDSPAGSIQYLAIFAVGVSLFLITLGLNALAARFVKRFRLVYA
jgi:phosphate transport system permease protein